MTSRPPVSAPPTNLQLAEGLWPFEALMSAFVRPPSILLPGAGRRRHVLVLPGFGAGDESTRTLRATLRNHGHWVHGWGLGPNIGPTRKAIDGMRRALEELNERHAAPLTLVGWSLGGVYARALARERPELVNQVITLGSPYQIREQDRSTSQPIWDRLRRFHDYEDLILGDASERAGTLTMPTTSVYTRSDGVVRWQLCVEDDVLADGRQAENIEVYGTHMGLGFNASVAFAVLDRLARPTDSWQPFQPPALLRGWYPGFAARRRDLRQAS